jgi:hypothetical protein
MVIDLGDPIPMAQALQAFPVSFQNPLIGERKVFFEPPEEGGTEIEADMRIVIDDVQDLPVTINDSGMGIRPVAFGSDPLVPVMIWRSALFPFDDIEPGALPGGLIEMAVNGDKGIFHQIKKTESKGLFNIRYPIVESFTIGENKKSKKKKGAPLGS